MHDRAMLPADARRSTLLELYACACAAVDGRRAVRAALAGWESHAGLALIAVGKAASAMTLGALDVLGTKVARGLVISRAQHFDAELRDFPSLTCLEGDHPIPGPRSLAAGAALLAFVAAIPRATQVLVLVSGGASSLVEALPATVSPSDLERVNDWGLAAGLGIGALNAVRRRLSRLKDGRLAALLAHTDAQGLLISDVPGDDPAVIGSGLIQVQSVTALPPLPDWLPRPRQPPPARTTRAGALAPGATLPSRVVATLDDALTAAERAAERDGLTTRRLTPPAAGDARAAASRFAHELALSTADVLVWGGETSVELPAEPGRGGRNQHFALAVAQLIDAHPDLVVLAAGTDGTDGNSADAGAIVDGGTVARAAEHGLDPAAALAGADSGALLEAAGDLLHTGPTGTNVGDIVLGLRRAPPPDEPFDSGRAAAEGR